MHLLLNIFVIFGEFFVRLYRFCVVICFFIPATMTSDFEGIPSQNLSITFSLYSNRKLYSLLQLLQYFYVAVVILIVIRLYEWCHVLIGESEHDIVYETHVTALHMFQNWYLTFGVLHEPYEPCMSSLPTVETMAGTLMVIIKSMILTMAYIICNIICHWLISQAMSWFQCYNYGVNTGTNVCSAIREGVRWI